MFSTIIKWQIVTQSLLETFEINKCKNWEFIPHLRTTFIWKALQYSGNMASKSLEIQILGQAKKLMVLCFQYEHIRGFMCKASRPETGHLHKASHYHPYFLSFYYVFKKWELRLLLCSDSCLAGNTRTELPYYPVSWSFECNLHRKTSCFVAVFVLCLD